MSKFILTFISISSLFISCDKNNSVLTGYGSVELVFKARYDTLPLVYGNEYDYFGLGPIIFTTTDFFYSSVKLVNATDTVLVKDVDYASLMANNTSVAKAEEGLKVLCEKIPTGEYNTLNFNIGLSPGQNKTTPADYQTTHPLGESSRYWTGWKSYIFSKTEGTFNSINYFAYHSGFNNAMRSLHFSQTISVKDGQKTSIEIQIDYKKMFDVNGVVVDIPSKLLVQDTSAFMMSFLDQFQTAISLK